jgi:hypothetical protein
MTPQEREKKPCSVKGCPGTMTYSAQATPPSSRIGFQKVGGTIVWDSDPQPGWLCDKSSHHFEPVL